MWLELWILVKWKLDKWHNSLTFSPPNTIIALNYCCAVKFHPLQFFFPPLFSHHHHLSSTSSKTHTHFNINNIKKIPVNDTHVPHCWGHFFLDPTPKRQQLGYQNQTFSLILVKGHSLLFHFLSSKKKEFFFFPFFPFKCEPWPRCFISLLLRRQPLLPLTAFWLSPPSKNRRHPHLRWRRGLLRSPTVTRAGSQTGRNRSCRCWPFLWPFWGNLWLLARVRGEVNSAPWRLAGPLTCAMLRMSPSTGSMASWACHVSSNQKSPQGLPVLGTCWPRCSLFNLSYVIMLHVAYHILSPSPNFSRFRLIKKLFFLISVFQKVMLLWKKWNHFSEIISEVTYIYGNKLLLYTWA